MELSLQAFGELMQTHNWLALWPEMVLALLALGLLVVEMLTGKRALVWVPLLTRWTLLVLAIVFAATSLLISESATYFAGMITISPNGQWMRLFFIICALLAGHLAEVYLRKQMLPRVEFYHIMLLVTAGLMLLVQSSHLAMLFIALETVTIGFYVLVSYGRAGSLSLEAGLKYLILGALSSAILLIGIVLLYGAAGNPALDASVAEPLNFAQLGSFLAAEPSNVIALVGALLVVAGIAFKVGAVPFQIWIPDVYQGAPTPTTALLAVASKAGGIMVLINLLLEPLAALRSVLLPVLLAITLITVLFGNLAALGQKNLKRVIGMSGVAHAGYLLLGVCAAYMGVSWADEAVIFYLFIYMLASFGVFEVMAYLSPENDTHQQMGHYRELARRQPFLALVLGVGLGSLAGIPPLAGFIGKLLIFIAAWQAGLYGLLVAAIIGVVISIYYYFGWLREATFTPGVQEIVTPGNEPQEPQPSLTVSSRVLMTGLTALTLLLGFYQGMLSLAF